MPIALRPCTTATRAAIADIERAISSARPITRDDLMPGAGSNSYNVTTGPGRTLTISPLTPKSSSTPSRRRAFCSRDSGESFPAFVRVCSARSASGGNSNPSTSRSEGCASLAARRPDLIMPGTGATTNFSARSTGCASLASVLERS